MNYTITNPKGIDSAIQKIQTLLYNKLNWGDNIDVYGRVFENPAKTKGLVLEAYISNNEYKDVFFDDSKTASIFFIEDKKHTTEEGVRFSNKVQIVFMVDLKKVFPNITHRADTEAEIKAIELIRMRSNFSITEIEKGISSVFKGYNTDTLKLTDMQPYHVFSINGILNYNISCLTK